MKLLITFITFVLLFFSVFIYSYEQQTEQVSSNLKSFSVDKPVAPEKKPMELEMNTETIEKEKSNSNISFNSPEKYSELQGITTFRGNNYRNSASYGFADVQRGVLSLLWSKDIGSLDNWSGVGWNGQPVIVKWDYTLQQQMNIAPAKKNKKDLKEVIYGTLDGNIYFLDLETGLETRKPISIGAPIKGSVSVDPRGMPLLYSGQGFDKVKNKKVPIGYRIFNLLNQEEMYFLNGEDEFALREWGAFDSNVLIHPDTDTMLLGGENGILYKIELNTRFDKESSNISIKPRSIKYRYNIPRREHQGIENSIVAHKNYVYFADNGGFLQALDINTLKPLWVRDVTDDTDSTIVLEEEKDGQIALYTACEVDLQGANGKAYIRKIDALDGSLLWEKAYKAYYHSSVNGGVLATPVIGKKDISNLIIYNIARVGSLSRGLVVALDKNTGEEVWSISLDKYSWSSPVDIYTPSGKSYIILGNSAGYLLLIDGITGNILHSLDLGANIEGSPAVFENTIVVGTRGKKIFGIEIK